jgi:hypothetical protein
MVGGRGVRLDPVSVVREAEFFLALDPREDRRFGTLESRVRIASALRAEWLESTFPESIRREKTVEWDEARGRAVGVVTFRYLDLVLQRTGTRRSSRPRRRRPWPRRWGAGLARSSRPTRPPRPGWPACPACVSGCPSAPGPS